MDINMVLALIAGFLIIFSLFSTLLQRLSLPAPILCLAFGVLIGPFALDLIRIEDFGVPTSTLLEEAARITLAMGLAGIALRLPHGYWRRNIRWVAVIIGLGMAAMLVVSTGVLWAGLDAPLLVALLFAAVITPTDPVVTTPIVTGPLAQERIPQRVRHNLSAGSGINDGLGHMFVMLAVLLLTSPATAAQDFAVVVLWEILGGAVFGLVLGFVLGRLFVFVRNRGLMDESSYLVFLVPFSLFVLGVATLLNIGTVQSRHRPRRGPGHRPGCPSRALRHRLHPEGPRPARCSLGQQARPRQRKGRPAGLRNGRLTPSGLIHLDKFRGPVSACPPPRVHAHPSFSVQR